MFKFLLLVVIVVVGWFWVIMVNFGLFNVLGGSFYIGIGIVVGVVLFSFIGVEILLIVVSRVENFCCNVGCAVVLGTG